MQALLSFDQAPPLSAPLRFFLTAPLFGVLAGVLLLWSGAELFASRWTPAALALTHLVTVGFMMQIMLGSLIQILPVVAGAHIAQPRRIALWVHGFLTLGSLSLVAAFLSFAPILFQVSVFLLGAAITLFIIAATSALLGVPSTSPTIIGLKLALFGLAGTVILGLLLSVSLGWSFNLPLMQLAELHLGWGFVGWGVVLLAAVSLVVVPMFQLTPAYSAHFERYFPALTLACVALWTAFDLAGWDVLSIIAGYAVVASAAIFATLTLNIQRHSKRPSFDTTMRYWQMAMFSTLTACVLWLLSRTVPMVADWQGWPLLVGVLVLFGGFLSVMIGMLYKIVPFLIWLHLQNQGVGRVMAPNMKKVIKESAMQGQMWAHFAACALLLLAVFWPAWFVYPAGVLLIVDCAWLMYNLWSATRVYRAHQAHISSVIA